MAGRRWPAAGMSHVASNIHVAGRRNAFSQRSLSNVQIARLALLEVNEKMPGRCAATKAFRHGGALAGRHHWGCPPQWFRAAVDDFLWQSSNRGTREKPLRFVIAKSFYFSSITLKPVPRKSFVQG